jgi:hypothetical protein
MEDRRSWLVRPSTRIHNLLLGPPSGWAQLANRLDEALKQLRVELATQREADVELEALRTLATRVQDLVLGSIDGSSSLAASMYVIADLLDG